MILFEFRIIHLKHFIHIKITPFIFLLYLYLFLMVFMFQNYLNFWGDSIY